MTAWYRSQRGEIVHAEGCARMGNSVEWEMVRGWEPADVITVVEETPWLRLCKHCGPGVPA